MKNKKQHYSGENNCFKVYINKKSGLKQNLMFASAPVTVTEVLFSVFDRTGLADDGNFDLTGIGHLFFDAGADIFGKHLGITFTDLFRSD